MKTWSGGVLILLFLMVAFIATGKSKKHSTKYINVLVAVDDKMRKHHGRKLNKHIISVLSTTDKVFRDRSIGRKFKVTVTKIVSIRKSLGARNVRSHRGYEGKDVGDLLAKFCKYMKYKYKYDVAVLLTRQRFCSGKNCFSTVGLAYVGTMCEKSACAVVRDYGKMTGYTIAHELGHSLNSPHDNDGKCQRKYRTKKMHVMNPGVSHTYSWSKCSSHYINEFLRTKNPKCLSNIPHGNMLK